MVISYGNQPERKEEMGRKRSGSFKLGEKKAIKKASRRPEQQLLCYESLSAWSFTVFPRVFDQGAGLISSMLT
jgi:hypothetical protein